MEETIKNIKFIRGDTFAFCFARKDIYGNVITSIADEIIFTVKENYNTNKAIIQKKLSLNDVTYTSDDNLYHVIIEPQDTDLLKCSPKKYVYDIEVTQCDIVTTIAKGTFTLENDVTRIGDYK